MTADESQLYKSFKPCTLTFQLTTYTDKQYEYGYASTCCEWSQLLWSITSLSLTKNINARDHHETAMGPQIITLILLTVKASICISQSIRSN